MEQAVRTCLQKYATFSGRAVRPEFWWWALAVFLASMVAAVIDILLFGDAEPVGAVLSLALLLPNLAVGARRLHDTGRSGWWQLIGLVPLIGWIVLVIFWAQDGTPGANRFGPDPKGRDTGSMGTPAGTGASF